MSNAKSFSEPVDTVTQLQRKLVFQETRADKFEAAIKVIMDELTVLAKILPNDVLLGIVIERLHCLQAGPFKCAEHEEALRSAEAALDWLKERTLGFMDRGDQP